MERPFSYLALEDNQSTSWAADLGLHHATWPPCKPIFASARLFDISRNYKPLTSLLIFQEALMINLFFLIV